MTHGDEPSRADLDVLDALVDRLAQAEDDAERDRLRFQEVPDHMFLTLGLREHVSPSGLRVVIEDSMRITVPAGRRPELHEWLRENDHLEELSELRAASQNKSATRKAETAVLAPLATRLLADGAPIDLDLLGVTRVVIARLSGDPGDRIADPGVA